MKRKQVTDADRKAAKVRAFLAAIQVHPNITHAAKAAGIDRTLHHKRYKTDAAYKAAFNEAWEIGVAAFEDRVIERAFEGVPEPVIYQGVPMVEPVLDEDGRPVLEPVFDAAGLPQLDDVGNPEMRPVTRPLMIRKFSVEREKFILAGLKPDRYRQRVEHSGEVTINIAERLAAGRKRIANDRPRPGTGG